MEAGIKFCGSCGHAFVDATAATVKHVPSQRPVIQKTMMGVAADFLPPVGAAAPVPAPAAPAPLPDSNRTVLGMPATPMPNTPEPAAPVTPSAPAPAIAPNTNRTMLGMPMSGLPVPGAPPAAANAKKAHLDAQTNRTMLGVMSASPNQATPSTSGAAYSETDMTQEPESETTQQKKSGLKLWLALGALIALLVVGSLVVINKMKSTRAPLAVSVVSIATGDALQVDVQGAENGTKLRFSGQELPLAAGRATFPIESEALHVGDNALQFTLIAPDHSSSTETVHLAVDYRVRADIQAIDAAVPAVDIVVDAHPGAHVTLDGSPLVLNAQGHGVRRVPINTALAAAGVIEVNSRYTIADNGSPTPAEGTLASRIAVTTLQLQRPGRVVTTDRPDIEVTGLVETGATVTVDGVAAPVTDGHFTYRLNVPETGDRTLAVVARAHGKAPQTVSIQLHRVANLADEASRFGVDRTLTYARIAAGPNGFVGQKIELIGQVFNSTGGGGQSVLQMLVRDCPVDQRCQVWVTYPAATDVALNSTIRVIGTVGGEQQYRSQSGRAQTAPRVDAAFILPYVERRR